jgi:hypothetical protein
VPHGGRPELTGTGRFRWVVCQLLELRKCVNVKALRHSLRGLPRDLDETYERILCSIDDRNKDYALRILRWVTYSMTPLTIHEVARLVAIDITDEGQFNEDEVLADPLDVFTICPGLVSIYSEKYTYMYRSSFQTFEAVHYIRLAHYSVQEYLVSSRIFQGKAKFWGLEDQLCHSTMAQSCLVYLLNADFNLVKSTRGFRVDTPHDERRYLAKYCSQNWWKHASRAFSEATDNIHRFEKRLFRSRERFLISLLLIHHERFKPGQDVMTEALVHFVSNEVEYLVKQLLKEDDININANARSEGGRTALEVASLKGYRKMVELLLQHGADVQTTVGPFGSALAAASSMGHGDVVKLLIRSGAPLNDMGPLAPLSLASWQGHE